MFSFWFNIFALIFSGLFILVMFFRDRGHQQVVRVLQKNLDAKNETVAYWCKEYEKHRIKATEYKKIAEGLIQGNLAKVSHVVDETYKGTIIKNHILKANEGGQITIEIGVGEQLIEVDMDLFKEDSHEALDRAKAKWIEKYDQDVDTCDESNEDQ